MSQRNGLLPACPGDKEDTSDGQESGDNAGQQSARARPRLKSALDIQMSLEQLLVMQAMDVLSAKRAQVMVSTLKAQLNALKLAQGEGTSGTGDADVDKAAEILKGNCEMLRALTPILPQEVLQRLMQQLQ